MALRAPGLPGLSVLFFGAAAACLAVVAAGLAGSTACTATTTINTALVTDGIQISSYELFNNLGCSAKDVQQPYKYLAVVINQNHDVLAAGIFDCFADAVFANLPGADAGELKFAVWLYVYNFPDFQAANANNALVNAVYGNGVNDLGLNGLIQPDGSVIPLGAGAVPQNGVTRVGLQRDLATVCQSDATWTTVCGAVSQAGVQVSANCSNALKLVDKTSRSCTLAVDLP